MHVCIRGFTSVSRMKRHGNRAGKWRSGRLRPSCDLFRNGDYWPQNGAKTHKQRLRTLTLTLPSAAKTARVDQPLRSLKTTNQTDLAKIPSCIMRRTMRRGLLLLTFVIALSACSKQEEAQAELARQGIDYNETKFIESARDGNAEAVKLFLDGGMNTEVKTRDGQTPLMVAALANKADVVKLLLDRGADVNAKNKYGGTALMNAAWKGHAEVVELLLAHRPDLNIKDYRGMDALAFAAWENQTAIVKALLNKGAQVDATDSNGWTPLMRASFKGHTEVIQALIEKGASINTTDTSGKTALNIAEDQRHTETVELLKNKGAR